MRTNRVLEDLRILSNCANKNNYEYTEEEAQEMFRAIETEVKNIKTMFLPSSPKKHGIYTKSEIEARAEIHIENYTTTISIEANTMLFATGLSP